MADIAFRTHAFPTEQEGDLVHCNGAPGSHVASWVREALVKRGYACGDLIQEDYGWGFWIEADGCTIWVSAGYASPLDGEPEELPEWHVGVDHDFPPWALGQWFRRSQGREVVRNVTAVAKDLIASHPDITVDEASDA